MVRRSASSRKLLKELPPGKDITRFLNNLKEMDARTLALRGTALLQVVFEKFLRSKMRIGMSKEDENRMFDSSQGGFLSTFSAQIRLAYALELIDDKIYSDLLMINDIRNVFAHTLHELTFEHPLLAADTETLSIQMPFETFSEENKIRASHVRFLNTIFIMSLQFNALILATREVRKIPKKDESSYDSLSTVNKKAMNDLITQAMTDSWKDIESW